MHGTLPLDATIVAPPISLPPGLSGTRPTIRVPEGAGHFWRKLLAFSGPGYLVAVGYMDPGNWATDIAGGSAYGYALLSVVLLSSLMAMLLQALSARLGIVTGLDLAQACRERYSPPVCAGLWALCEVAIIACDLAEVVGTAIGLQLLFHIPIVVGVCLTAFDTLLVLALQRHGFRKLEAFIVALLIVIAGCFAVELLLARPAVASVLGGFAPSAAILINHDQLYLAIGIIGATVMPHNLYLHSSIVRTRSIRDDVNGIREALKLSSIDSTVALTFAMFINVAILVLAASSFNATGHLAVADIGDAYRLLSPMLGTAAASLLFGIALLASGQNSTVTGTLAGQIVMEGFLDLRIPSWLRRLVTRSLAIVPAVAVAALYGDAGVGKLLVLSQVVLSLQLPFAVVPLVRFTSDRRLMGPFAMGGVVKAAAWIVTFVIIGLNATLLWGML